MQHNQGVPASPSGYSAEPEPSCTVSAVPVSIPNALGTLDEILAVKDVLKRLEQRKHKGIDRRIHNVLGRNGAVPRYSADLLVALDTIPQGWWWHLSHMECTITPNAPDPLIPVSNASDYKHDGRPIGYTSGWYGHRTELPFLVVQARLLSMLALLRKRRAVECGNYQHVDTGKGPLVATPDGRLSEIHHNKFLTADNRLRRRRKGDHGSIDPVFVYSTPACDRAASGTLPRENTEECSRAKPSGPTAESGDAQPTPVSDPISNKGER